MLLFGCTATSNSIIEQQPGSVEAATPVQLEKVSLEFEGMTCPSCALGVEYELKQLDGVIDAQVLYPEGTGVVTFDSEKTNSEEIAAASTVYPATFIK